MQKSFILFTLQVFLFFCTISAKVKLPENKTIPALFSFGDSILDTGNNNNLNTVTKCNFLPYGRDFVGGRPTGRFCNGKVPSDLIRNNVDKKFMFNIFHKVLIKFCFFTVDFNTKSVGIYLPATFCQIKIYKS